ncbi:exonuclease 3'-5' domain-containing protein 1 [Mytilus galloprovincialis]|uniref:Exonuclease 3'-5' domain-containing protein 1 n=1 Tax=Mytilus galloprovincialis TaxID=29158 RepID=A0A8B6FB48_MYTGA|nr:exonuclease 3'-5' domain-containing protein 1 [Mytilus galloprovincialis]
MATKRTLDTKSTEEQTTGESKTKKVKISLDSSTGSLTKENVDKSDQSSKKVAKQNEITCKNKEEKDDRMDDHTMTAITIKIGMNETSTYKYVDTKDKFIEVIKELQEMIKIKQMIAVDCEGVDLSRFGSVTLINIGTRDLVYLIDILKIGNSVFDDGLRTILEDSGIEKLMFDCREDADALLHLHKVKLDGVLDVQILEVSNRVHIYRNGYTKIRSLKHCLEEYVNDNTLLNIKLQGRSSMNMSSKIWEKRPLDENMLKYASVDILGLFKLYDALRTRMSHSVWKAASSRYCDTTRSRNRMYRDGSGILPKGVII